jgi:hypothetical protein
MKILGVEIKLRQLHGGSNIFLFHILKMQAHNHGYRNNLRTYLHIGTFSYMLDIYWTPTREL